MLKHMSFSYGVKSIILAASDDSFWVSLFHSRTEGFLTPCKSCSPKAQLHTVLPTPYIKARGQIPEVFSRKFSKLIELLNALMMLHIGGFPQRRSAASLVASATLQNFTVTQLPRKPISTREHPGRASSHLRCGWAQGG
jgi:hypothetical protein